MKVNCPKCGEKVEYVPGSVLPCGYCKASLKLPEVSQLPEDLRDEWLKEQAVIKARQEKARKKREQEELREEELRKQRAEETARREREEADEKQRIAFRLAQQQLAAVRAIPEEQKLVDYSWLLGFVAFFSVIAFLLMFIGGITVLISFGLVSKEETQAVGITVFGFGVSGIVAASVYSAGGELIRLAINVARDIEISRKLLTRLVHPDKVD